MAQSRVSGLDETTNKYPTITIAIIGHGEDLINEPISEDPNIRIFSRAGQPFCLGIGTQKMLIFVENLYISDERDANKNTKSAKAIIRVSVILNSVHERFGNSVYIRDTTIGCHRKSEHSGFFTAAF